MSNSTMHLGSLLRHLQHLSSLLQRCCHGCCVLAHRGVTWQRGFCRVWVASDDECVAWIGSQRMQAAEASQMKDWFDRVYPNKKRYLIGLRSMAWDAPHSIYRDWTCTQPQDLGLIPAGSSAGFGFLTHSQVFPSSLGDLRLLHQYMVTFDDFLNDVLHLAPDWIGKNASLISGIVQAQHFWQIVSTYREPVIHETSCYLPFIILANHVDMPRMQQRSMKLEI